MMHAKAPLEHLLEPEDLGQAPVSSLQSGHRLLHEDVNLGFL